MSNSNSNFSVYFTFYNAHWSSGINCGAGKYGKYVSTNSKGANSIDSCKFCIRGKFSETVGEYKFTKCQNCPTGYSQNKTGQAYCLPCVP